MNKFQIKNIIVTLYLLTGMLAAAYSFFDDASDAQFNQHIVTQIERVNLPNIVIEPVKNLIKQHCAIELDD
jgi:hypothetical protein